MTDTPAPAGLAGDVTADSRLVLVEATHQPALPGDPPLRLQITAERTRHPNLVIAPAFSYGRFQGEFMLMHVPSGLSIRAGFPAQDLRALACRLHHLDWSAAGADGALPDEVRALALDVLRTWQDERDGITD